MSKDRVPLPRWTVFRIAFGGGLVGTGILWLVLAFNHVHHTAVQTATGLAIAPKPSVWPFYAAGALTALGVIVCAVSWNHHLENDEPDSNIAAEQPRNT